jgi:hypothetical protein
MQDHTGALALGSRVHEAMDQYYSSDMTLDLLEIHSDLVAKERKLLMDDYRDTYRCLGVCPSDELVLEGNEDELELELEEVQRYPVPKEKWVNQGPVADAVEFFYNAFNNK